MRNVKAKHREHFLRLSKEGSWIVLGNAMAVLGSVVGVRVLTELLDPIVYGELALGMTVATLVNQTVLGPLANGITRFYAPALEQGQIGAYLKGASRLVLMATAITLLLAALGFMGLLVAGRAGWLPIAAAALIFAMLSGYNSLLNGVQNAARQRSVVALHQGAESWARFLAAAGLIVWLGSTGTVAMIGNAAAVMLILGSQCVFFRKAVYKSAAVGAQGDWQKKIWTYSWPFATWGIFSWAQQASDRWALELLSTTQEVGFYAVLAQLGYYPISLVTGMAVQLLAPIFYQRAGDASDSGRNANVSSLSGRLTALGLAVTGVAFVIALLFHPLIFSIFAAKEYRSASHLLPWMVLSGGIFAAGQMIALNLMSQMKTHAMMRVKISTALLGIASNFAGAYWYGIRGIVIAGLFFSVVYFIWMVLLSKTCGEGLAWALRNRGPD